MKMIAHVGQLLTDDELRKTLGVFDGELTNQRVLVLIPDRTWSSSTLPISI